MVTIFNTVITTTITAISILLLKIVFRNKLSPKLHLYVWTILLVRMLLPVFPQSQLSIFNIVPTIDNVNVIENRQEIEKYSESDKTASAQEYITGDIDFGKFSKPFSIKKDIETSIINIWLIGAVSLFLYFLAVYILFCLRLQHVSFYKDDSITKFLTCYKEKMQIKRDISLKLYGSTSILMGIFKPIIILPEGYSSEEASQMIIHELCHLKHKDILLNILSTVLLSLNWYNPIIWICYYIFKSDIEVLCDQKVIEITGNKRNYASLLLKTSVRSNFPLPMTTCMNSGKKDIKRRIYFMANFKKPNALWATIIVISIAMLSAGCLSSGVSSVKKDGFSFQNLNSMLGMDKEKVIEALKVNPQEDATSETVVNSETLTMKEVYKIHDDDATVSITFYNDILTDFRYTFNNISSGYNFVKEIREQAGEIYGEPSTYPGLENRLDNLTSAEDISKVGVRFYEEWAIEASEDLAEKLLEGREVDRLTVSLELVRHQNDASTITFRYAAVPKLVR